MEQRKLGERTRKPVQSGVVMKIRWKLHCEVVTIHVPTGHTCTDVKEKEELIKLVKVGKFSFYVKVDYLKNKK